MLSRFSKVFGFYLDFCFLPVLFEASLTGKGYFLTGSLEVYVLGEMFSKNMESWSYGSGDIRNIHATCVPGKGNCGPWLASEAL